VERAVAIQVAGSADRFLKTPSMGELRAFVARAIDLVPGGGVLPSPRPEVAAL
jgi:hypothetical protein